jgi:flagellar biosynthetic protein FliR
MDIESISSGVNPINGFVYILQTIERYMPIFFLVVSRIFGMTLQTPFFNNKALPAQVRATLIVSLAIMYMLTVKPNPADYIVPTNIFMFTLAMIKEVLVGVIFGFCAYITVAAIQAAGEIIDVQMGLSMVTLFNPQTKSQSSATGRLFYQIESMVFILAQGHLLLLSIFFSSFELLPIGKFAFNHPIALNQFILVAGKLFYIAAKMSLPLLVVLFLIDFSLGITNKVSPQINVLELMTAMKPTTGMLILLILCSTLVNVIGDYKVDIIKDAYSIIKAIAKSVEVSAR